MFTLTVNANEIYDLRRQTKRAAEEIAAQIDEFTAGVAAAGDLSGQSPGLKKRVAVFIARICVSA